MAYSIEAALQSGIFDEVMVSTEDEEIAALAKQYGAKVPFYRSEKTSEKPLSENNKTAPHRDIPSPDPENGCQYTANKPVSGDWG